jgi:hypothetical protein
MFPNSDFWSEKKPSGWQPWFQLHLLSVNSSFDIASIHLTQVCANFLRSQIELPAKILFSRKLNFPPKFSFHANLTSRQNFLFTLL